MTGFAVYPQAKLHSKLMDILPPSECIVSLCILQKRLPAPARQPDSQLHTTDTTASAYDQRDCSSTELMSETLSPSAPYRHKTYVPINRPEGKPAELSI